MSATRIVERRGGAEIVLRKARAYGVVREARDGGRSGGWGRGVAGFWNKVDKQGDSPGACWVWLGYRDADGYGKWCTSTLGPKPKTVRPHRMAYEWERGPIPAGLVLMHLCDNPACVNPEHLRPGTQAENIRDCYAKGRHAEQADTRGEMSGCAKLRNDDVHEIRSWRGVRGAAPLLAKLYGMSVHHMRSLLAGRGWKHLANPRNQHRRTRADLHELREVLAARSAPSARAEDFALRGDPLEAA